METSAVQMTKLLVMGFTGLSRDALHIYVGLIVYLVAALLWRRSFRSVLPWLAVILVAMAGELLDMRDDLNTVGHWRWKASLHDIVNTSFWPGVLLLLARLRLLGTGRDFRG